jgi:hypothetical protein
MRPGQTVTNRWFDDEIESDRHYPSLQFAIPLFCACEAAERTVAKHLALLFTVCLGCLSASYLSAQVSGPRANNNFSRTHQSQLPHNATSCSECHAVPVIGGSSRIAVARTGSRTSAQRKRMGGAEILHTQGEVGGTPIAVIASLRVTINLLGDGYIEAVPDEEFLSIAAQQHKETHDRIHGECTRVTLPESGDSSTAVGRFGWKAQHASLLSAAADALKNELGVPNRFFPEDVTSPPDKQAVNDTDTKELESLVSFIRSTEPIPPDSERMATDSSVMGLKIFDEIGCSICHVRTLKTASKGAKTMGGAFVVPERFSDKEIHPYSDFLLHDVGTGDGLIQNIRRRDYAESTANKFRTAPLWGVRFRSWLMHDGKSITYHQAIMNHAGEASEVIERYERLTPIEKEHLREFLDSL